MLNPLYKMMDEKNMTPAYVAHLTSLTPVTIRNISRMRPQELKYLRLNTAVILKKTLGIDLIEYLITM